MTLPAFSEYSPEHAPRFYLGSEEGELFCRSDAGMVVHGTMLPVHSDVLSSQSAVLKRLFSERRTDRRGGSGSGHDRCEVIMTDHDGLEGYSLKKVCEFLRFLYHPEEINALSMHTAGAGKAFTYSAMLAHQLAAPQLLQRLAARMEAAVDAGEAPFLLLLDWVDMSEQCGLEGLWAKSVQAMARQLAADKDGVVRHVRAGASRQLLSRSSGFLAGMKNGNCDTTRAALADVAMVQNMSSAAQLAIFGALLAGLRRAGADPAGLVPTVDCLAASAPFPAEAQMEQ